ncbi:MAG: hypothetical protein ACREN5_14540, partial [Gemmatimonadales bacterium]
MGSRVGGLTLAAAFINLRSGTGLGEKEGTMKIATLRHQCRTRWVCPPVLSLFLVALAACGGGGGGTIGVTLQEWAVIPAQASLDAGEVTFEVGNTGPEHHHEFVVISSDLAPNALPTNPDGSVNEEG